MPEYFKNLDALRFYAFFLVFISHVCTGFYLNTSWFSAVAEHLNIGDLGVTFFFVLSGFLITTLLLREVTKTKTVNIKSFYIKRIKRIWPVYYIVLFFKFIFIPVALVFLGYLGLSLMSISGDSLNTLPWFIFFAVNLYISYFGFLSPILNVLWSISVEEQFYLIWPWFIKYLEKYFYLTVSGLILISIYFKYTYYGTLVENFHTFSAFGSLSIGSLGAYCCYRYKNFVKFFNMFDSRLAYVLYVVVFSTIFLRVFKSEIFSQSVLFGSLLSTFSALIFLVFILEQALSLNPVISFGKFKIFSYLGKISYGLYAYHVISLTLIITFLKVIKINTTLNFILYSISVLSTFILTLIMAYVSYEYIEKRVLKKTI